MTYTATLFDCPVSSAAKAEATEIFCTTIESALGGEAQVAAAYAAFDAAFQAHGEMPLPSEATDAERVAVARWEAAARAAEQAAFAGCTGNLGGAHFEISI